MTTNAERDVSANTQTLIDLLRKRDALGLAKYGVSLDRTDLSATDWIQHAVEELLDGAAYLTGLKRTLATPVAPTNVLPHGPAGRELPDGPGFWQRYGEKWVIRQHTESMFFGCHCDANGYLGRTIAVLPKGGWRRADAGDAEELAGLRAAAAWIREHHNGFNPAAREAMDMAKPRTLVEALEQLEAEHEWLLNDAIEKLATARTSLPEACRRLKVLEPLGPNIAENLQVVESDGDFDFVLIRIPLAQAREMLAALTWEETNDG